MFDRFLRSALLATFATCGLYAQAELATITGSITDNLKAVIPGAKIIVRNIDTQNIHSAVANHEGYYTVPELPPGPYTVEVVLEGFDIHRTSGIVLQVGQSLRHDVEMKVGSITNTVDVTADALTLNTENGMIKGQVIVQAEINDMPLNGRDFTELALYVPGVTGTNQGGAGSFASINGARADNTNYMLNGIDDRNVRGANSQLRPNIDALQEFKMEVSGYSAEYGKMAGGILNMVLKSGANNFHGSAFAYVRNEIFDARAYFDNERLPFKQYQFGGLISGPLQLGKLYNGKDRTFFMFSWETLLNPYGETYIGTVPTLAQHQGDFSGILSNTGKAIVIKDPLSSPTNQAFPNGIIPASRIDPIAARIMQYYPRPNRNAVGNNYQIGARRYNNFNSFISRGDHRFNDRDSITLTYGKRFSWNNNPSSESNLGLFDATTRDDRQLGGISWTHMFTPSIIFEGRFGLSRNSTFDGLGGHGYPTAAQLGIAGTVPGTPEFPAAFPTVVVTNYLAIGYANGEPVQYFVTNYGFHETLTWIKGAHILKMGTDISRNRFNQPYFNNSRGTMTASGVWTGARTAANGDAVADLELGLLASSSIVTQPQHNYMRNQQFAAFFTDDWKIRRDLTLNLGLRYEIDGAPYDLRGGMTNFIPDAGAAGMVALANIAPYRAVLATNPNGNLYAQYDKLGLPSQLISTRYNGFAPRIGLAWRPFGSSRMVVRTGYGIFMSGSLLNDVRNRLDNVYPLVLAPSFSNVAANPNALTLANPWPGGLATQGNGANGLQHDPPLPYLQSYNLTIERQIGHSMIFESAYVGSKGTHLGVDSNINTPYRTLANYVATGTFPSPYPAFGTINYYRFVGNSIYSAGQFTLRNRSLSNGLTYRLSYTYSKSIDTSSQLTAPGVGAGTLVGAVEDPRNLRLSRARSDWDRGHIVQGVFSYNLPFGQGKRFVSKTNSLIEGIIGGWLLAGTALMETGQPMTVLDSSINAAIGESAYPNRIAKGAITSGNGRRGIDYRWFDPAAFPAVPACVSRTNCVKDQYGFIPFTPGNSGRGVLDGPGLFNINSSMLKNWRPGERKTIQFRAEAFNIFNHPNFVLMNRQMNETAAGYLTSVANVGNGGPRTYQFALKYMF